MPDSPPGDNPFSRLGLALDRPALAADLRWAAAVATELGANPSRIGRLQVLAEQLGRGEGALARPEEPGARCTDCGRLLWQTRPTDLWTDPVGSPTCPAAIAWKEGRPIHRAEPLGIVPPEEASIAFVDCRAEAEAPPAPVRAVAGEPAVDVTDRATFMRHVRHELHRRSGLRWSVTGGRGYGWVTITALPGRLADGRMTDQDQKDLAELLGLDDVHRQGVNVAPQSDYRREYAARASGEVPTVLGKPDWD